jgi:hypothetical protein
VAGSVPLNLRTPIALVACKVSTQPVKVAKWADLDLGCKRAVVFVFARGGGEEPRLADA